MKRVPMYDSADAARKGFSDEAAGASIRTASFAVRSQAVAAASSDDVERARDRLASFMRDIAV